MEGAGCRWVCGILLLSWAAMLNHYHPFRWIAKPDSSPGEGTANPREPPQNADRPVRSSPDASGSHTSDRFFESGDSLTSLPGYGTPILDLLRQPGLGLLQFGNPSAALLSRL